MKKAWLLAGATTMGALLLGAGFMMEPVKAQQFQGIRLAVIDVFEVFNNYTKMQGMRDGWKNEAEQKESQLRATMQLIQSKMEQMKNLRQPEDREAIEKELNDLRFNFERDKQKMGQEMQRKEIDILGSSYKEMSDLLGQYCKDNGIHIVLRQSREELDKPQGVMATVQRNVIYSHPNLDLTKVITDGLNHRAGATAKPAQ